VILGKYQRPCLLPREKILETDLKFLDDVKTIDAYSSERTPPSWLDFWKRAAAFQACKTCTGF
jgi:hypothetical protein